MPSSLVMGVNNLNVVWASPIAAYATDRAIFVAPYACVLIQASEIHSVLGTDAGAVNIQLTHDTGTQAPGTGSDLLNNNAAAGFNLKAANNTVQFATWKPGTSRKFAKGDRLSVDFAGVQTVVDGLVITATFNRSGTV